VQACRCCTASPTGSVLGASPIRPRPPASPRFFRNSQKCCNPSPSLNRQKSGKRQNWWNSSAVIVQSRPRVVGGEPSCFPVTMHAGAAHSTAIEASSDRTPRGGSADDDRQSRVHRSDRFTSLSGVAARSRFAKVRVTCGPVPDVNPATVYGFRVHGLRAGDGLSYPAHEPNNEKHEQNCSEYAATDIHVILH